MRRLLLAAGLLLSSVGGTARAAAAPWEATLFAGYRGGGEFREIETRRRVDLEPSVSYGLSVGRWLSPETRLELTWSGQSASLERRSEDVRLDHLHVTGFYEPVRTGRPRVYVLLSAGLTRLASDFPGADDELEFSGSAGVGVRLTLTELLSLRLEGRAWAVITDADAGVFCAAGCELAFDGSGFTQAEGTVGLSARF